MEKGGSAQSMACGLTGLRRRNLQQVIPFCAPIERQPGWVKLHFLPPATCSVFQTECQFSEEKSEEQATFGRASCLVWGPLGHSREPAEAFRIPKFTHTKYDGTDRQEQAGTGSPTISPRGPASKSCTRNVSSQGGSCRKDEARKVIPEPDEGAALRGSRISSGRVSCSTSKPCHAAEAINLVLLRRGLNSTLSFSRSYGHRPALGLLVRAAGYGGKPIVANLLRTCLSGGRCRYGGGKPTLDLLVSCLPAQLDVKDLGM